MAGEAKSDAFMLGTATVMLGAQADLMNLSTEQSVGLMKNVMLKTQPGFTELTQGVKNTLVYSVMTSNKSSVDAEMYEYTSKNLSYCAGLDGSAIEPTPVGTTLTAAEATSGTPAMTDATVTVVSTTGLADGDYVFVQVGTADQVFARKIVTHDATAKTLTFDSGLPVALPIGTHIRKVNVIAIGSLEDQPFLSCKIVGTLANGDEVVILLPKVRVTSGLSLGFKTDNFDHIPFQLEIYDLVATDPNYAMFQSVGPGQRPAKAMFLSGT